MAQLAVAVVGGVIGSFFGMPQLGFLAGSLLGQLLFPTKGPDGPRLSDLRVTSSTYGQMIRIGSGTMRVGGNIIFADPIKEHKDSGKGMGAPTTYTYSWTGGVAIGRGLLGPIAGVTRIWADTKLVFDKTGQTNQKTLNKYKLTFRLYTGTEDQMPDPAHEAAVGADNAQAYRGLAYVVFDNIPLADYGNRVPSWTFEVAFDATTENQSGHEFVFSTGGVVGTPSDVNAIVDPNLDRAFFFDDTAGSDGGIITCDVNTGDTLNYADKDTIFTAFPAEFTSFLDTLGSATQGLDGAIYATTNTTNSTPIYKIDADGLVAVGVFGVHSTDLFDQETGFVATARMVAMQVGGLNYMLCGGQFSDVGVFCTDTMTVRAPAGIPFAVRVDEARINICPGRVIDQYTGTAFGIGHRAYGSASADPLVLHEFSVGSNGGMTHSVIGSIVPTDVNSHWANFSDVSEALYDFSDGNVLVGVSSSSSVPAGSSQHYIIKLRSSDAEVMWTAPVNSINGIKQALIANGEFSFASGSRDESYNSAGDTGATGTSAVYTIITEDGTAIRSNWPISNPVSQTYDGERGAIIFHGTLTGTFSSTWGIIYVNRALGAAVPVGDIIKGYSRMVGYQDVDLDVSDVTDMCEGYVLEQQATAADVLKPLALAFQFDGVESDDVLKFIKRGHDSKATIPLSDMAYADKTMNIVAPETRMQEVDLPRQVSINFFDPNHDYQQATQYVRRPVNPVPSMYSNNTITQNFSIVMEPTFAKQLGEAILYTGWVERISYKAKLSWKYLKYDPTDNLVITLSDDSSVLSRFVSADVGVDWSIDVQCLAQDTSTYSSNASAYGGDGFPQQIINGETSTKLFLLDMPLLRDVDDTGQSYTFLYWAAGEYDDTWPGVELYKSNDGGAFSDDGGLTDSCLWGVVRNTVGSPPDGPFVVDHENSITVKMVVGSDSLSSCTYLEMCNSSNAALLLSPLTGVVEIVQFQTVTPNADGTFTLSNLFRGRRGTDVYCDGHQPGGSFILLTDATGTAMLGVGKVSMALSDLNVERFFRGATAGTLLENAPVKTIVDTGRTLKPYAPTHVAAVLSGSDIDLSWRRRTRVAGGWGNGTDSSVVALAEATEAYDVDIYNDLGDTVLRTLSVDFGSTPTADPGLTYLAADIATDFGSTPTELTLAVYQKSGAIGRGFGYIVTVPVM